MKNSLTFLVFVFLTIGTFAKGGSGTYYIKGTAYGTDKSVLKNTELTLKIGETIKTIKTDDTGQFEIEVPWSTPCRSDITKQKWEEETERINPKYLYLKNGDKEIKMENEWKKYAKLFPESKDKVTMKKNLYFV